MVTTKEKILNEVKKYYEENLKKEIVPGKDRILPSGKLFDENELINAVEAVLDGWWTTHRFTSQFENKMARYLGIKHVLICNSGSSANLLAFNSLCSPKLGDKRIEPDSEVITVAAGFPTTVNPIIVNQCIPVFLDVDIGTYNMKTELLDEAITDKTRAIFVAHTLGNPFNLDAVMKFVKKHDLWLIEDTCDALGSEYNGKKVGTFGHMSTYSFYPAHQISMGEGGAVASDNNDLKMIIESIRDWGRDCWCLPGFDDVCGKRFSWKWGDLPFGYDHKYTYSHIGYNLKPTDMQGAIGLAQLDKLPDFVEKRRENFKYLYSLLKEFDDYLILPEATKNSNPAWFGFLLTIKEDSGIKRNDLVQFLEENKIATRLLFSGNIIKQPYFIDYKIKYRVVGALTNTDTIMNNTFWIGVFPRLSKPHFDYIYDVFKKFFTQIKK